LDGALRVAEREIEQRVCLKQAQCWLDAMRRFLSDARAALDRGDLDQGWRLLHAAQRAGIHALNDDDAELASLASTLRSEADKLKSWRQKAIERLLGTPEKPAAKVTVAAVYEAASLRDEYYDNQAYKDRLLKTQMLALVLTLGGVMVALALVASRTVDVVPARTATVPGVEQNAAVVSAIAVTPPAARGARSMDSDQKAFVMVALFGLLGSTVSAMLRASDTGQSARIPELTAAVRVTFMRILMGGASAIVVYVFLKSDLGSALTKELFSAQIATAIKDGGIGLYTACAIAFVAGFSERLVLRAVESVAGKAQDRGNAKAAASS
jgi:hypothetical protein